MTYVIGGHVGWGHGPVVQSTRTGVLLPPRVSGDSQLPTTPVAGDGTPSDTVATNIHI